MRTKPSRLRPSLKKLALSSAGLGLLSFRTGLFGSALGNAEPAITAVEVGGEIVIYDPATTGDATPVGGGAPAVLTNASVGADPSGNGKQSFNLAANGKVELPVFDWQPNLSFSAWIYSTSLGVRNTILDTRIPSSGIALYTESDGRLTLFQINQQNTPSIYVTRSLTNEIELNQWQHIGFSLGPNGAKIYLNGEVLRHIESHVISVNPVFVHASSYFTVGSPSSEVTSSLQPFIGSIRGVRFFNRELTNSAFSQLSTVD